MGIGVSVFLIAVGAVLAFAVNVQTSGIDLATVGWILMIAGGIGLVTTLLLFGDGGWWGRRRTFVESDVVDRPVVVEHELVEERPIVVDAPRRRVTRRRDVDY